MLGSIHSTYRAVRETPRINVKRSQDEVFWLLGSKTAASSPTRSCKAPDPTDPPSSLVVAEEFSLDPEPGDDDDGTAAASCEEDEDDESSTLALASELHLLVLLYPCMKKCTLCLRPKN